MNTYTGLPGRKADLEAALLDLGLDLAALIPLQRHERIRRLRATGMDMPKAVAAEAILFPRDEVPK